MPRTARILVPNTPHHIVQRGHNRNAVFSEERDYRYYLASLQSLKKELEVQVYSYCLMTNHIHLIIQSGDDVSNISKLMKRLAGRQTRYVNKLEGRTGTLWESRFKSSPIQTERYLLACCRYIEMNPVKAGIVSEPQHYEWSSYNSKVGLVRKCWIDFDPLYFDLDTGAHGRICRYRNFVTERTSPEVHAFIQSSVQRGQLTGNDRFVDEVEKKLEIRVKHRRPGRPRNK